VKDISMRRQFAIASLIVFAAGCTAPAPHKLAQAPVADSTVAVNPLPSWNDDSSRQRIVDFVHHVTTPGDPGFVPVPERIATFDNDGTLWAEQPFYFQGLFALDRIRALAPEHPEWKKQMPFKAVLNGDMKALMDAGQGGLFEIVGLTHAGMTITDFRTLVKQWLATARHPQTHKPFTDMVYQPQLELLAYLRANGFKTFIVSGGGVEFMRAWTDSIYGIPPEQVVGTRGKLKYELRDGKPVLLKLPAIDLMDDKDGKPIGIAEQIGRKPIIAVGNSDGDYEMLDYTTTEPGTRLGVIIHHDDAAREYAYDRKSPIGHLAVALDSAPAKHWLVVSMKDDWKVIYPK
jgi:phosphoglycolate phosphatase-like HAD superfamily hydrolase